MFLSLPKVRSVSSYKYISRNKEQSLTLSNNLEENIPLSDCKLLLSTLEKHNKKYNEVKFTQETSLFHLLEFMNYVIFENE